MESEQLQKTNRAADIAEWKLAVARFQRPSAVRAWWQVFNTIGAYVAVWAGLYFSLYVSWGLTIPLIFLAGLLLVRVFIIFHDCGHGSFFASRWANDTLGTLTGLLTFTAYYDWRGDHAIHHGAAGDLEAVVGGDRLLRELDALVGHEAEAARAAVVARLHLGREVAGEVDGEGHGVHLPREVAHEEGVRGLGG